MYLIASATYTFCFSFSENFHSQVGTYSCKLNFFESDSYNIRATSPPSGTDSSRLPENPDIVVSAFPLVLRLARTSGCL